MSQEHDQKRCREGVPCSLCQVGLIVEKHNKKVTASQKTQRQEIKEEIIDTLRDLRDFTNRNTVFSIFVYMVFMTLLALLLFR